MVVYITLPDDVFVKLSKEAEQKGMDGKTYIKKLLEQYVYSKVLFSSRGAIDLTPVLEKLESIESRLAKIEERLNNLEQKQGGYRTYQRRYERAGYQEREEADPLEEAIRYAKQVLANNNNVITDEQLEKIAEKFKVSKLDIIERLYLIEKEPGKWSPQ